MDTEGRSLSALVKEIRRQLSSCQEDPARRLGVSYATVKPWENGLPKPSKLAKALPESSCKKMTGQGKLTLSEGDRR